MIERREFVKGLAGAAAFALSSTNASVRGRVLVIGAGLAGMVAALELRNAGHDVTILEASQRPGGRVHTLREPFSDGLYAEAGAGRIPSTHDLTLRYVRQFGLQLLPFYPSSGREVYLIAGKRSRVDASHPLNMAEVDLRLTSEERRVGLAGLERKYMDTAQLEIGQIQPKNWPSEAVLKKYGNISIETYLKSQGASDDAIEMLVTGYQPEAALDFLRDLSSHRAPKLWKIVGGNDLLPKGFAARLSANIIYDAQVMRMEQNETVTRVTFVQGGLQRTLEADYMICAIPFSVLRKIEVSPAFSDRKRQAVDSITYGSVSRVYLQTRSKFWSKEGDSGFAVVNRAMEVWNPTWNEPSKRGILMTYAYEKLAREIAAQTPEERIGAMLGYFDKIHPGMAENFELGSSWVWDEQPFARGAYCVYQPGELSTMLPAAMAPERRILFAGEHCSSHPGWMQGALESGLRASEMVQRAGVG